MRLLESADTSGVCVQVMLKHLEEVEKLIAEADREQIDELRQRLCATYGSYTSDQWLEIWNALSGCFACLS